MYLSDAQVLISVVIAVFSCGIIGVVIGLLRYPIYMPSGLSGFTILTGPNQSTHTKYISPEYMLRKGKFHKVKSKMQARKKEDQLDFAAIEKNNFVGYEYLKKPYLMPCLK